MNDSQLIERLASTDLYRNDRPLPETMRPDIGLLEIARRTDMDTMERVQTVKPPRQKRNGPLIAAAAFAVVVIVGLVGALLTSTNEGTEPANPTTTAAPPTTTATTTEEAAGATPLTTSFGSLEQGTYRLDNFGTPIMFTVENSVFFVMENRSGFFALAPPNSRDLDDRDMVILPLSALSDPAAPNASRGDQGEGWPADDFGGWLDNLTDGVLATDREDTTLGSLPAIRVDLELGDIECLSGDACVLFDLSQRKSLNPGVKYRIWVVEQETEEPLAVILAITSEADLAWWDAYEQILSTLAFGDGALP